MIKAPVGASSSTSGKASLIALICGGGSFFKTGLLRDILCSLWTVEALEPMVTMMSGRNV